MKIKKYTASSMKEALLQIKNDLGEDALILNTKQIPRKLFSLGNNHTVEVTAASEENGLPSKAPPFPPITVNATGVYNQSKKMAPSLPVSPKQDLQKSIPLPNTKSRGQKLPSSEIGQQNYKEIKNDIQQMKELLASILATGEHAAAGGFAGPWAVLYKRLVDTEINPLIAEEVIGKLKNSIPSPDKGINQKFVSVLAEYFPISGPLTQRKSTTCIAAFVGPTGTGKTTTIAKLAAYYSLNKKKAVSIITADTYRVAAIEQIRTFAEIMDIGLQVIFTPEEARGALEACKNDDFIFIDTAGRSQRNKEHMGELKEFLDILRPDETHLVLSATTKDSDLIDSIKRYSPCRINRLLFTKLDETIKLGNVFNTVCKNGVEVSYLTSGQSVPEDIELAQSVRFVQRLLQGSSL